MNAAFKTVSQSNRVKKKKQGRFQVNQAVYEGLSAAHP